MAFYCELDTLLLAECVMKFKNQFKLDFNLDCTNYISMPQLSFDAMLKTTECRIEKISDPKMLFQIEQNLRGAYINRVHKSFFYISMKSINPCKYS